MAETNFLNEANINRPEEKKPETVDFSRSETGQENELTEKNISREVKKEPAEQHKIRFIPPKPKKDLRAVRPPRDEISIQVERVLEEDLREQFEKMSPIAQQEFKLRGEETAWQIRELLQSAHIKVKKIFQLIADWLSMIPGVNRFFLEQEAKIKTDKIIAIKKQHGN